MEVVPVTIMKKLSVLWRKKKKIGDAYSHLHGRSARRKIPVEFLGEGKKRRRWRWRFWRISVTPRLRVMRRCSPKKLMLKMRDAYVRMMVSLASSQMMRGGYYGDGSTLGYGAWNGFQDPKLKEYDEKMLVEIYKKMIIAQQQQFAGADLVCSR